MGEPLNKPKWAVIGTAVLGLVAALFITVARYYDIQRAKAEAERAVTEAERVKMPPTIPTTQPVKANSLSLRERLTGTKWVNSNKRTFEWDADGKLFYRGGEGGPTKYEIVDGKTLKVIFGNGHIDTIVFDDNLTKFNQYGSWPPKGRPLFTGKRLK